MISDRSDQRPVFEPPVPQWKKELILKRRASLRERSKEREVGGATDGPGQLDFRPTACWGPSVGRMRLLETELASELVVVNGVQRFSRIMVEEKKASSVRRRAEGRKPKPEEDYQSDSSEELQYGPGIVNKLKTKYLSMTLRENQKRNCRPPLSNLRRATSLENMLEEEAASGKGPRVPHGQFLKKPLFPESQRGSRISHHHAKYLNRAATDSMKRARSMETLTRAVEPRVVSVKKTFLESTINGKPSTPSIINEDIVIVEGTDKVNEKPGKQCANVENKELPPPDVVKQTLKIFEPTPCKKTKDVPLLLKKQVGKPVTTKPPLVPPKHPLVDIKKLNGKPVLSPKPILSPEKRVRPKTVAKPIAAISTTTLKPLNVTVEQERPVPQAAIVPFSPTSPPSSPIRYEEAVLEKVTGVEEQTVKYISQLALENISKEGLTVKYCFNDTLTISSTKNYLPKLDLTQATNTALISQTQVKAPQENPAVSPPTQVKQIAVIRPVVTNKTQTNQGLTDVEIEKNHINRVKSIETNKLIPVKNTDCENNVKRTNLSMNSEKSQQLWDKKPWQNQNSVVFNFSDRKSIPDYIENDGLILTTRRPRVNGSPVGEEDLDGCFGEPEDGSDPPCVRFVGDNILINGKSNLRKEPKQVKLRIQFNDEATTLFEYPSEESMTEEITHISSTTTTSLTLGIGSLSSYTPCKTGGDGFELGVTRAVAPSLVSGPVSGTRGEAGEEEEEEEEYLKPAESAQVTPWSQETAADLLF